MHLHLHQHLHQLKKLIELSLLLMTLLVGLVVAYQVWRRGSRGVRVAMVGLAAVVIVGYQVWRHTPPFEQGMHSSVVEAQTSAGRADTPHVGSCEVFPADNIWNTPIDKLAKDKHSAEYVDSIGPLHPVHADFGSNLDYGIPYTEIPDNTKRVKITFDYREESDLSNYPIPPGAPIENGPDSKGDRHVLLVDQRRCLLYEIYDAHPQPDGSWTAGSGVRIDLTDNALRTEGKTSADAAGLPILPGLVRYEEVTAGAINHALRFTIPKTQAAYVWPGRHKASRITDVKVAPMGERFRLRANFDVSKYSKTNQVIMKALKRYGMFLADNGSSMFLSGVSDKRWDDGDLHKLADLKAEDFEAVDESEYQLLPDSGRVDPVVLKR